MTDKTPLQSLLHQRRTFKALGDQANPLPAAIPDKAQIEEIIAHAARAPFHYPAERGHRENLASPLPFRFYLLDRQTCRTYLKKLEADQPQAGKILKMLAVADALVLTTWLPDPAQNPLPEGQVFEGTLRNQEHLAAAGAAAQNLLLLATEAGFETYWSSGGVLAREQCFADLGILTKELLLGAIFFFPKEVGEATVQPGALHDKRGGFSDFAKWCKV